VELIGKLSNLGRKDTISLRDMLPRDFIAVETDSLLNERNLGTKTRLAIKLPQAYDRTKAFQIKRTAYGLLGIGKVTQFGPQGLEQEFFFRYEPRSEGPFVDAEAGIVGIHRQYERQEQGLILISTQPYRC